MGVSHKALIGAVVLTSLSVNAGEVEWVTLAFHSEALDLDTGVVGESVLPSAADGGDVQMAYNALRPIKAVVVPAATGVELALCEGVTFDGVTADLLAELVFTAEPADVPFRADVTVVVRTDAGGLFKIGNASETDSAVTFNYAAL